MTQMAPRAVGIPWYRREEYPRILEIMDDAHTLHENYNHWHRMAEETENRLLGIGQIVVRAMINPDTFPAWCAQHGVRCDGKGRARYGAWFAARQVKQTQ
jgi:hypothetical protein